MNEKSTIQQALERAYSNPQQDFLNPDNHDKVNIALGLFEFESNEKNRESIDLLRDQIRVLGNIIGSGMEMQVNKMIASNKELSESNEKHSKAMNWLTAALVVIGIGQVVVQIILNSKT